MYNRSNYHVMYYIETVLIFSECFSLSSYLEMSSPSDFLRKGYNEMIQPLTSTVGLAEHLADRGYVAMDTVDQLNLLEAEQLVGVSKAKDILVNILVSKGTSKVVEIKKCIRAEYSNSPYTSGQSNSPYTCTSGQSNSPYTSGQSNSPYTSGQSNSPYTSGQSNSPYTSGQSNSPYTSGQSNSPYTSGQSNSPYTSGQSNSSTLPVEVCMH